VCGKRVVHNTDVISSAESLERGGKNESCVSSYDWKERGWK